MSDNFNSLLKFFRNLWASPRAESRSLNITLVASSDKREASINISFFGLSKMPFACLVKKSVLYFRVKTIEIEMKTRNVATEKMSFNELDGGTNMTPTNITATK